MKVCHLNFNHRLIEQKHLVCYNEIGQGKPKNSHEILKLNERRTLLC